MSSNQIKTYCQYCENRASDLEKGIYCGITKEKPSFSNTCPYFKMDKKAIDFQSRKLSFETKFDTNLWDQIQDLLHKEFDPFSFHTVEISYSKIKFVALSIFSISIWLFFVYDIYTGGTPDDMGDEISLTLFITIVVFPFLIHSFKKIFSGKPVITLNKDGIEVNGRFHTWTNYVGYKISQVDNDFGNKFYTLEFEIIGTIENEQITIRELTISKTRLCRILDYCYDTFVKNLSRESVK